MVFWACILFSASTAVFAFVAVDWSSAFRAKTTVSSTSLTFTSSRTTGGLATLTALVRTATAPRATATPTVVPPLSAGGVTIEGAHYRLNTVADPEPAGFFKPASGKRSVAVNVTVDAGDRPLAYGFTQFRLIDADGNEYTWALANNQPKLEHGTLQPGQSVTGWMAFAVPLGVKPVALLVRPGSGPNIAVAALP